MKNKSGAKHVNRTYCAEHNDGTVGCEKQPSDKPSAMELDFIEHGYSKEAAQFMVRIINNRDELLGLAKAVVNEFESSPNRDQVYVAVSLIRELRDAIVKAEGK